MDQRETVGGTPNEALASVVRREQGDRSWSLNDLADASGIPASTLRRYRSGERQINVDHLFRLADAFGMSPESLLGLARALMVAGVPRPRETPTRRKPEVNPRSSEMASNLSGLFDTDRDGIQTKPTSGSTPQAPDQDPIAGCPQTGGRPHAI